MILELETNDQLNDWTQIYSMAMVSYAGAFNH